MKTPIGLANVLRHSDLLVLQSAWVLHNVRAAEAALRVGIPYLLAPRGAYDPKIVRRNRLLKRVWWTMFERRLVRQAAGIHVFFDAERSHVQALGYGGTVVVAPNGVEVPVEWAWEELRAGMFSGSVDSTPSTRALTCFFAHWPCFRRDDGRLSAYRVPTAEGRRKSFDDSHSRSAWLITSSLVRPSTAMKSGDSLQKHLPLRIRRGGRHSGTPLPRQSALASRRS